MTLALHNKAGMIDRFKVPRKTDLRDLADNAKKHIDDRFEKEPDLEVDEP